MPATLKEIAAEADVAVSTASRALSGHPSVNAGTVAKIRQIAESMQYRQRRRDTGDVCGFLAGKTIGVLSLGMDRSLVALPAVTSSINGAESALSEVGAQVHLIHVPDLNGTPAGLDVQGLDGVILTGAMQGSLLRDTQSPLLDQLRALPSVWVLGRPNGCWGDAIVSNDFQLGTMAAEHLVDRGHRHLAFVNPKPDHTLFMRREDGFVGAALRLGAEVSRHAASPSNGWQLPLQPPLAVETVQDLVDQLLATTPRPTAIFAAADSVATLVYRALAVRDLRVGRDISVISGNNDYALIAGLHPHLTTFDIHAHEIGRTAVRQLAVRFGAQQTYPDCEIMVPTTHIVGKSVADLSGKQ